MAGQLLNEQERTLLEEFYDSSSGIQQRRTHLILLYDDGLLTHQAAEQAGFSRSQARFWKHRFLMDRLAIFPGLLEKNLEDDKPSAAAPGVLDEVGEWTTDQQPETTASFSKLPFPGPLKSPGVLSTDTLAEAGRKIWLYQFAEMILKEGPTISGEDIEDLHDMRVATRRMRSAFEVFQKAFKPKIMRRYLKGLRATGRALGSVRDMDVLIEKLDQYVNLLGDEQREGIFPLKNSWLQVREKARQALLVYFNSQEYLQFKQEFNKFVQMPGEGVIQHSSNLPMAHSVCEVVPALIYSRMGAVRAYDSILNNASDTQLHALRIEFKKLRYAIEYFREVLGGDVSQVIGDLKLVQDHLGNFHDAVVARDLVTKFLKDWEKSQLSNSLVDRQSPEHVASYLAYLHAERHRLLVKLPAVWEHFNRQEFRSNLANAIAVL